MKVVLLPQAAEDLDEIADPLFSRIIGRIESLKQFPSLGAPMFGPFSTYRSFVVGLFRVVYRVRTKTIVEIAYVRHCRRRPVA